MKDMSKRYSIKRWLAGASIEELEKWASDPNCDESEICAGLLTERQDERETPRVKRETSKEAESQRLSERRTELENIPFDPRTEVSADAKHIAGRIITHLWILFILVPVIIAVLLAVLGVFK
jgi:hypothetical protein